ncbi:MAG TPA: site-2 protease family protein [Candidatus Omnitrophota bacterium]|nr:site-2 protease family protein [Candidatus Omnitrophota bacterium]
MNRSFKLATVLGIPVEINYSWFIIFGLVVYTLSAFVFPATSPGLYPAVYWIMGTVTALLLFLCLLLHELAHSWVAVSNKLPILSITLFIFGGVAQMSDEPQNPDLELRMAAAGPTVSVLLGCVSLGISSLFYHYPALSGFAPIFDYLVILNFSVAVFNLFPGFPLDGGRIFRSLIWKATGDLRRATRIASNFGKGLALLMMAGGFYSLITVDLLRGVWLIFLGLFLMEAAENSYQQMRMKKVLASVHVDDVMTENLVTVPGAIKLDALLNDYFFKFRYAGFPVVEDDTLLGIVTFHDVKEIPRERWGATSAAEAMEPIGSSLIVEKGSDLITALARMAANPVGRVLVIDNGKLVGIVSKKDIVKLFELKEGIGE